MAQTKILVVTHKEYPMPEEGAYTPILVGGQEHLPEGYIRDNTGDNIAAKNPFFCELTALYYAWKNVEADNLGLVHYRRHLHGKAPFPVGKRKNRVLTAEEAEALLEKHDFILPKKRNYYIETLYSHYAHTMYVEPLDEAGKIIAELCPLYSPAFEQLKKRRSAHMFNMFVAKKAAADAYCAWLFPILFELEKRIDTSQYTPFHARFFGRVSELLLDVYIITNGISYTEVGLENIEPVNWWKKGTSFLKAKFKKEKYGKSF
ncbi:MAG: DUF4422 domain-containing protein [Clostridia bacterium]|nr:DUF4422 domain-containing protein [Clostridia bacterium]